MAEKKEKEDVINISIKKLDKTQVLTILVSVTLLISIINFYGIFIKEKSSAALTGNVISEQNNEQAPSPSPSEQPQKLDVPIGNSPILGGKEAKITIIEFSDYQCPFCSRFYTQTLPQLKKEYLDTGKAKLIFKDFPLPFHDQAQKAAEAARCVRDQRGDLGYFKMHDKLFENQESLSIENEKRWAREIGVDGTKFDSCLDTGFTAALVAADIREGSSVGVQGTPSFIVNGRLLVGAQPFEAFKQILDEEGR